MAINQTVKWLLLVFSGILVVIVLVWYSAFGPGWTMHETARILIEDDKFGERAQARAIHDGDAILPSIIGESRNFEKLNWRNSFWIAEVIGAINAERSESIARDLYTRSERLPHLVGAVALAEKGRMDAEGIDDLVTTVTDGQNESEAELAMLALGKAHARAAGPILVEVLSNDGGDIGDTPMLVMLLPGLGIGRRSQLSDPVFVPQTSMPFRMPFGR